MTVADFQSVRSRLFGIAYQMLGRTADAEDVVQDVWVRWQGADRARVRDPVAFLVTITTRVALNTATSACARREVSAGGRLPELDPASVDPAREAERGEALEVAVQFLMERLSPVERAVYVLHEAFDYPFREIAEVLELSEANARQLACRARQHLAEQRHNPVDPAERDGLRKAFVDAARFGDMALLIDVLSSATAVPSSGASAFCGRRPGRRLENGAGPLKAVQGSASRLRPGPGSRAASGASSGSRRTPSAPRSPAPTVVATRRRSSAG